MNNISENTCVWLIKISTQHIDNNTCLLFKKGGSTITTHGVNDIWNVIWLEIIHTLTSLIIYILTQ